MLQLFESGEFLFDQMIPPDREALLSHWPGRHDFQAGGACWRASTFIAIKTIGWYARLTFGNEN
jgi:hypothetical protein